MTEQTPISATEKQSIDAIRMLSVDAINHANSGHPGLPMGCAPMAYVLWKHFLRVDPSQPDWPNRDRFVLSAGHGSMLIYSLLHLAGFDLAMSDIKNFRQWDSKTPGHPEFGHTAGIEATTGPLGQGTANAVGMAMAERKLANLFNGTVENLVDHFTYALVSDGDLMEGISSEAASIAGHLGLGKLIYLYDANDVTLDGPLSSSFSNEDVAKRYEAHGWHVQWIKDGDHDLTGIKKSIDAARAETKKPSLIIVKTTIGYGSPNRQGLADAHGAPLGEDETALTRKAYSWTEEPFGVPAGVMEDFQTIGKLGSSARQEWEKKLSLLEQKDAKKADLWSRIQAGELPQDWDAGLGEFKVGDSLATRVSSGTVINQLAKNVPHLLGGDADLGKSTNSVIKGAGTFDGKTGEGRNVQYGVREHAMAAILNGMLYHGGIRPFAATFFCFSDYMKPSVRLAALAELPAVYVWTHDSFHVGEDGPTHQPVEHIAALRALPNFRVIRPGDANEVVGAWKAALLSKKTPTGIVLSRQKLTTQSSTRADGVQKGAYAVGEAVDKPTVLLFATGSEVGFIIEAQKKLLSDGVQARAISVPCWEIFFEQPQSYRDDLVPTTVDARLAVEAGTSFGWERFVGLRGNVLGLNRFGASAPGPILAEKFGFTADNIVAEAKKLS